MLAGSKVGRMMREARGGALDVDAVARALVAVTDIGLAHPEVVAIDVNPIIVGRDRAVAVDAVIERATTSQPQHPVAPATSITLTEGATP